MVSRAVRKSSVPPGASRQTSILIVEDEAIVALDLQSTVERLGYPVVGVAATGAEALAMVAKHRPGLALMDIRLTGDADGIETAARMQSIAPTPVVFLTANADEATLSRALDVAPGGYLPKPYGERALLTTIEVALRSHDHASVARAERDALSRWNEELRAETEVLRLRAERLHHEALIDPLTGLFNRRHLDDVLDRELSRSARDPRPFSVLLVDLDHFKSLNDNYGHAMGDRVLARTGEYLKVRLRRYDVPCRFGGEELVVVLPGADAAAAAVVAENLRTGLASLHLQHRDMPAFTASIGVAAHPIDGTTRATLLAAADAALYRAKAAGRNRVVVAGA